VGGVERDCSHLDIGCMHGVCVEEDRSCWSKALADGTECGAGQTCHEGVCRRDEGCAAGEDCELACVDDDCHLSCDEANTCVVACELGADCDVDCRDTNNCAPACASSATCDVDCRDANNCDVSCVESSCEIRCAGAESCDGIVCGPGARCAIECDGSDCDFELCAANDVQQCPGDVLVCNGTCP
jgi:hypothetical protein